MARFRNDRGETMITILISIAVLAGSLLAALMALGGIVKTNRQALAPSHICREVAQNILTTIRSNGVHTRAFRVPTDGANTATRPQALFSLAAWRNDGAGFGNLNPDRVTTEAGLSTQSELNARWPRQPTVSWQGAPPYVVRTPLLIQSTTNALLAIFNQNNRTACRQPRGIPITNPALLSFLSADGLADLHSVNARIRIQPYNLNTGALENCNVTSGAPGPLGIRPHATSEPPEAHGDIFDYSRFRADLGLEVEIIVETQPTTPNDEEGRSITRASRPTECSIKDRVQYDRIDNIPATPEVTLPGPRGRIQFSIRGNQHEPGSMMVCRSRWRYHDAFGRPSGPWSNWPWGPCDRLQVCGSSGNTTVHASRREVTKEFNVSNRCLYIIDTQAVDLVGNRSDTQPVNQYNNSTTRTPPIFSTRSSDSSRRVPGWEVAGEVFTSEAEATYAANRLHQPLTTVTLDAAAAATARLNTDNLRQVNTDLAVTNDAATRTTLNSENFARTDNGTSAAAGAAATAQRQAATEARAAADRIAANSRNLGPIGEQAREAAEREAAHAEAEAARLEALERERLEAERRERERRERERRGF